jgi:O-antigen biosynthesis protein
LFTEGEIVVVGKTVSLVMIVRNEEHQLADGLTPVASLFDEIVVIDTGSVDSTREVARRFTPHVFDFPWCDDFSAARNECLRHSRGHWIFWLDADDRIGGDSLWRLRQLLGNLGDEPIAYLMNTVSPASHACEAETSVTHSRLFRRHPDLAWHGRVHEQLRPDLRSLGYELRWSNVVVEHLGYQNSAVVQRKLNRDMRLLRMDYAIDPGDVSTLVHLGLTGFRLGRWKEARQYLHRVLAAANRPYEHLQLVFCALATIELREGKLPDALACLEQGLSVFPASEHLQYLKAECLYEADRYADAATILARLLASSPEPQYCGGTPADIRPKLAPRKLADVHRLLGNFGAAETLLRGILAQFPRDTHTWYILGHVFLDSRQPELLFAVTEQLQACPQGDIFSQLLLATWSLRNGDLESASRRIESLISLAPQMPMPRILRATLCTLAGAPLTARWQAYRDVLRVQPGNLEAQRMMLELETVEQQLVTPAGSASFHFFATGIWEPATESVTSNEC